MLSISLQPSGFSQKTIGQRQDMICSVSLSSVVDPNSVRLSWLKKEEIITGDNRVTIIMSNDNNTMNASSMSSIIRFDPLFEEDEGKYTCYALINGSFIFKSIQLKNFRGKHVITLYILIQKQLG